MKKYALQIKRIYESPRSTDGRRILVDRLWPRGLTKAKAKVDFWAKDVAPSTQLRQWYGHDPEKWEGFCRRYFAELKANPGAVAELEAQLAKGPVTLLFSSKEPRLNNAEALRRYFLGTLK